MSSLCVKFSWFLLSAFVHKAGWGASMLLLLTRLTGATFPFFTPWHVEQILRVTTKLAEVAAGISFLLRSAASQQLEKETRLSKMSLLLKLLLTNQMPVKQHLFFYWIHSRADTSPSVGDEHHQPRFVTLCGLQSRKKRTCPERDMSHSLSSFSMYYLWLSPGNLYLMPGWDGKYFSKCLGRSLEHAAVIRSTIFPTVTTEPTGYRGCQVGWSWWHPPFPGRSNTKNLHFSNGTLKCILFYSYTGFCTQQDMFSYIKGKASV